MTDVLHAFGRLGPRTKRLILVVFDVIVLIVSVWLSFSLRLGPQFTPTSAQLGLMLLAPVCAIPVFIKMGLYRAVIRYLPDRAIWTILRAVSLATLIWVLVLFLAELTRIGELPRSVPIFFWFFGAVTIAGSRFVAKAFLQQRDLEPTTQKRIGIYGAGASGRQLAAALRDSGGKPVVAFFDDNERLIGRDLAGVRVYRPSDLPRLVKERAIGEIIVSLPSVDTQRRRDIMAFISANPVKIRALPAISDLAAGKYLISQVREIDIDDLLGRSSVPADPELLAEMVRGRSILVSGAGGSIGSELVRLIVRLKPERLVLLEANEFALYQIERQLVRDSDVNIVPVLGSVVNERLVRQTLADHHIDAVFHAAAHKHVPLVEANMLEGIQNNISGTEVITRCAFEAGVRNFVLISTDKAVRPTNVMGATKRWAELVVQHYGKQAEVRGGGQRFTTVRFGNVLGSNGSVVPLFKEQIAAGGPVTLTDNRMTRYFMSIHEAAELIVQAGALSESGNIFLLDMGEPVLIRDLAENMIRLGGMSVRSAGQPDGDIEIIEVGQRPGEKLYEELFYDAANASRTRHSKIFSLRGDGVAPDIMEQYRTLIAAVHRGDAATARSLLFRQVAESDPGEQKAES
jgi:FlaA1/EpsC-like NDP-sugar epimerase